MLDYEVIPVPGNETLDLLGLHYLHQLNDWLYLGVGIYTPLVYGNYGGFMAFDTTIHAQRKIFGNAFVDAGVSLGGGGGGSSIKQSIELSGTGGFIKGYVGLGYNFPGFSAGVNYAHFRFINSPIKHSQLNLFMQKPVSYAIGSYADSGNKPESDDAFPEAADNILSLELNNIFQVKPKGSYKKSIHSLSLQFSHFLTDNQYLFLGADVGYRGLPLYNQVIGGLGYKFPVSPHVNFYSQIGVGSGGYSPAEIDTGSGLLVYPKLSLEYLLNNNLGLSLSSGYLVAPRGTSKNFTLGAGMNYHLGGPGTAQDPVFRGFRISLFQQTQFNVRIGNKKHGNVNLLSTQFDYVVNDHWYIPTQGSVAYNQFLGYPGYGEILTGLGIQSKFSTTRGFQNFFQILIGANVHGVILKPSVGFNYGLSDHLALYGQLAKTISLHQIKLYPDNLRFSSYSTGLGLTYRFSLL
ncbi:MAG: hypothetical protein CO187_09145 [Zetaproteobacteria bacterium CG_4_9_14_3_um_filter_53_7]|nr:MAG: hypothetical protein CO187_09145 [Zetaproteobacteria bacterium CG_4_9_14_3_um_filter_53_7]